MSKRLWDKMKKEIYLNGHKGTKAGRNTNGKIFSIINPMVPLRALVSWWLKTNRRKP
jgi:hypothetical protein